MQETVQWERFPLVSQSPLASNWLKIQAQLGRAANTVDAYGRALEDYLSFHSRQFPDLPWEAVTRAHIAAYVHELLSRPGASRKKGNVLQANARLSNATLQQRLTVVRLFYDYLTEEGLRQHNPVGRGRHARSAAPVTQKERSLVAHYQKLPWIPTDEQWGALLNAAKQEPLRNRVMLAFAYDAALRREELCRLSTQDIDPAHRLLRIRAETTKNRSERVVPYSASTGVLFAAYLEQRRKVSTARGPLFLSESRRNRSRPISIWTWSKVVKALATRAAIEGFSTHTLRHLCLTDLARADWDIHQIALFAGHRNPQTTLLYIHLSGRDLKQKMEKGMASIHHWRTSMIGQMLQ